VGLASMQKSLNSDTAQFTSLHTQYVNFVSGFFFFFMLAAAAAPLLALLLLLIF
jgi:hypothetical protein